MDIEQLLIPSDKKDYKCFNLLRNQLKNNIITILKLDPSMIKPFDDKLWDLIKSQNYIPPISELTTFEDVFIQGYNEGNCAYMTRQLSYSLIDVSRIYGLLPILKNTLNSKNGHHWWLEINNKIIDTSLMLLIDKSVKNILGYQDIERFTYEQLCKSISYQTRKDFTLDKSIKRIRA